MDTYTINCNSGKIVDLRIENTHGDPVTLQITNPPAAGTYGELTILIHYPQGFIATDVIWPASVHFPGNVLPVLVSGYNIIKLVTLDGGVYWQGTVETTPDTFAKLADTATNGDVVTFQGTQWAAAPAVPASTITWSGGSLFGPTPIGNISYQSVAYGTSTLSQVSTGNNNVAIGHDALRYTTTGEDNVAVGMGSLSSNTVGFSNVAVGGNALLLTTTGYGNVAVGHLAANNITADSSSNVAVGYGALSYGEKYDCIAIGDSAQQGGTPSFHNISVGSDSLKLNNGSYNVAIGTSAMGGCETGDRNVVMGSFAAGVLNGSDNVVIGHDALRNAGACSQNVIIGSTAEYTSTTLSNNVIIGYNAATSVNTTNAVIIGHDTGNVGGFGASSNYIVLGNANTTNAVVNVAWSVVSDQRDKCNIAPLDVGLDLVLALRPKQFNLQPRDTLTPITGVRYGLLAQDVQHAEPAPVIVDASNPDHLKLNETMLIPVLINAIQELHAELQALKGAL